LSVANYFTLIRIFLSPIFLLVYLKYQVLGLSETALPYVLLALLLVSEFSDAFDGYIARKLDQVTDLGKIFDPMADSISRISVFLTFTMKPIHLPMLLVFVFIYRDSVISTLRTICAIRGHTLAARNSGKIKAVIQALASFAVIGFMILHAHGYMKASELKQYSFYVVSIAAVYAVISGVEYIYVNREHIKKMLSQSHFKKES
jgi:CDP-diacylglycerol---glycerol-3-phosphate 3-phosphatidyltransferase